MIKRVLTKQESSSFQSKGQEIEDRGLFVGCPLEIFAETSQDMFQLARSLGIKSSDRVLEVGCGCLRSGYWFINFLEKNRYFGIEPNVKMLDAGREVLLADLEGARLPKFDHNDRFDLGVFGGSFDWIVAFSVWTHTAKWQIEKMIDYAAASSSKLLVSFAPTHPNRPQYEGETWTGKSHQSQTKGIAYHDPQYLFSRCAQAGLRPYLLQALTISQLWIYAEPEA